ncbi:hypothetical protein AGLY_016580 [Aphis glycines]|uniref:Uncharacterized protein n=1 Tax=Aphis glycines TaxID=307491 RepID=A0A6G0SX99_APHGL|nr:hypothetical protein AGLY_016580 [Aphis glycines]
MKNGDVFMILCIHGGRQRNQRTPSHHPRGPTTIGGSVCIRESGSFLGGIEYKSMGFSVDQCVCVHEPAGAGPHSAYLKMIMVQIKVQMVHFKIPVAYIGSLDEKKWVVAAFPESSDYSVIPTNWLVDQEKLTEGAIKFCRWSLTIVTSNELKGCGRSRTSAGLIRMTSSKSRDFTNSLSMLKIPKFYRLFCDSEDRNREKDLSLVQLVHIKEKYKPRAFPLHLVFDLDFGTGQFCAIFFLKISQRWVDTKKKL